MQQEDKTLDILPRKSFYTNKMMVESIELLKSVVLSTKKVKERVGKKYIEREVLKFKTDQDVIDRILRSYNYYSDPNTEDMKDKRIPTAVISGAVQFRDYQTRIIHDGYKILKEHGFLYLTMEVRTGKTLTSLGICARTDAKNVLFITKKKAMSSIEDDYKMMSPLFDLTVVNYESLHHVMDEKRWDIIVCDEAHSMGAFPKPSSRAQLVKDVIKKHKPKVILLSGTPTPESYSQIYHQVYGIPKNPFNHFANFYRFCEQYVDVKQKKINGLFINDYSRGKDIILEKMAPYTISYTQQAAGFNAVTTEEVIEVEMKPSTYKLIDKLKKDLVIEGKDEVILADTPVKLMMKVHQLCSGTIKFESGNSMVIDTSKAEFIKEHFAGCKIGIFYKFKEELSAIKQVFGDDITTELSVFDDTDKSIALQIVSGREGISLRNAEYLVFYNIDFSATSYWQAKDRMTTKDRLENNVYWIFAKDGIESDIYKTVTKKKDYTINHFKKLLENG